MDRMAAIEAFVKVSETKSFTEAAARLGQSKSAVSRHITALETELGARLFHRSTRTLALTEAGIPLRNALDSVVGPGTYQLISDTCWELCQAA
ncbi:MAG: LysR family transcriptional regulator [Actinobacteria bacterium]|nr:LysR family transcriptional regulator [Actinomycetota bacterium]